MRQAGQWDNQKEEIRYQYDNLDKNSIVIDLGAYVGLWAQKINDKFGSKVHAYEAVEEFYNRCTNLKFINAPLMDNVIFHNAAVTCKTGKGIMHVCDEGSTLEELADYKQKNSTDHSYLNDLRGGNNKGFHEVTTIDINKVLEEFDIVHLLKMNIEGVEYDLLDRICDTNTISKIDRLQIQFHKDVENSEERLDKIFEKLKNTHTCYFDSTWRWSFWRKK